MKLSRAITCILDLPGMGSMEEIHASSAAVITMSPDTSAGPSSIIASSMPTTAVLISSSIISLCLSLLFKEAGDIVSTCSVVGEILIALYFAVFSSSSMSLFSDNFWHGSPDTESGTSARGYFLVCFNALSLRVSCSEEKDKEEWLVTITPGNK